jgi:hypothetical protein
LKSSSSSLHLPYGQHELIKSLCIINLSPLRKSCCSSPLNYHPKNSFLHLQTSSTFPSIFAYTSEGRNNIVSLNFFSLESVFIARHWRLAGFSLLLSCANLSGATYIQFFTLAIFDGWKGDLIACGRIALIFIFISQSTRSLSSCDYLLLIQLKAICQSCCVNKRL